MKETNTYRVWLEDSVEPEGGFWWYCYLDENNCLQDPERPDDEPDTLQWYIDHGYIVEEVKQKSWIEEAWEYSRMAINDDLPTTIEEYYEYQRNTKTEIPK